MKFIIIMAFSALSFISAIVVFEHIESIVNVNGAYDHY